MMFLDWLSIYAMIVDWLAGFIADVIRAALLDCRCLACLIVCPPGIFLCRYARSLWVAARPKEKNVFEHLAADPSKDFPERTQIPASILQELQVLSKRMQDSDVFTSYEKGRLLDIVTRHDTNEQFECGICLEVCTKVSPVHSHGTMCAQCVRSFVDVEVDAGRIPSCPTCRRELTLQEVVAVGASERSQRFSEKFMREKILGPLPNLLRNNERVLPQGERIALASMLDVTFDMQYDASSETYIRATATPCPRCFVPCHRVDGCTQVRCRCGHSFQILSVHLNDNRFSDCCVQ
jgi:hypothetical protein